MSASRLAYTSLDSPIGELLLVGDRESLHGLYMQEGRKPVRIATAWRPAAEPFSAVRAQLRQYFAGERAQFELSLTLKGSAFERRVWRALQQIPYGDTASYGEIARRVGSPTAARAVGLANGRNPIAVIVPCHRVIGSDGGLTGYGGGLERKRVLLELERGQVPLLRGCRRGLGERMRHDRAQLAGDAVERKCAALSAREDDASLDRGDQQCGDRARAGSG
jgi:methylated-DNA-[protein]-cysteine S-methyltransferase